MAKPINAIFVSAAGTQYRDSVRVDHYCADLRMQPFDTVFVQVRFEGEALYNSQLTPKAIGVDPAFDPLATLLRELHAPAKIASLDDTGKPKKVIAWFDPYTLPNAKTPGGINPQNAAKLHPDWMSRRSDGATADSDGNQFLEPGLTDVQLHLEQVIAEIVKQYPIDGLLIDNVADPAGDGQWGFHPAVIAQWQKATGKSGTPDAQDPSWIKFRADLLSEAAAGFVQAAKQARPGLDVLLSGDASGPPPASIDQFAATSVYTLRHQNWPHWIGQRLTGEFVLKDFRAEHAAADDFDNWLKLALGLATPQNIKIINAVSGPANESVDALAQLRRSLALGAAGIALSDYETPVADIGARQLFMSAVERTVLAPQTPRLRLPLPEELTNAAGTSGTAAANDATINEAFRLTPILRTPQPVAHAAGMPNGPGASHLDIPPPPPLAEVADEGEGSLIPAHGPVDEPASHDHFAATTSTTASAPGSRAKPAERGGDATMAAINRLAGMDLSGRAVNETPTPAPVDSDYVTRRQMLAEIMGSAASEQAAPDLFTTDPQALNELHQKFRNIF